MIALYPMIAVINAVITCSSHCSDQMQKYIMFKGCKSLSVILILFYESSDTYTEFSYS